MTPIQQPLLPKLPEVRYTVIIACITGVISIFVTMQTTDAGKYQTLVDSQNKTIETLNVQLKELEVKIFELTAQLTQQQIELSNKYEQHADLKNIMNSAPFVSWFNLVSVDKTGKITFPMYHINSRYTYTHGVTLARYKGQTSDKIWPKNVADSFHANNLIVLNAKDGICTIEVYPKQTFKPVSPTNPMTPHKVCKWLVPFEGGYGILGMAL